jgi:NAD(P)-dependent dehydrogenase (short-subunit alcohol dehydrogenase family)
MEIQERIAFVTGGASGIGRATVVALAGKGVSVVIEDDSCAGAVLQITIAERATFID